jgi:hypothetical protein
MVGRTIELFSDDRHDKIQLTMPMNNGRIILVGRVEEKTINIIYDSMTNGQWTTKRFPASKRLGSPRNNKYHGASDNKPW